MRTAVQRKLPWRLCWLLVDRLKTSTPGTNTLEWVPEEGYRLVVTLQQAEVETVRANPRESGKQPLPHLAHRVSGKRQIESHAKRERDGQKQARGMAHCPQWA